MGHPVAALFFQVLFLSAVSVGGFITVIPEFHRFAVDLHGWMSDQTFLTLFALAQAAPGPNMIVVTLVGWEVAGPLGAAAGTIAVALPTLLIAYTVSRFWSRYHKAEWYRTFERGIAPFAVGLILSVGIIFTGSAATSWASYVITAATLAFLLFTRRSPLIPLAVAAAIGLTGLV